MRIHTLVEIDIESGAVTKETGFEYEGPLAMCGGGGTTVQASKMSSEEKALLATQNQLLQQQLGENAALKPFLLQQMGLKEVPNMVTYRMLGDTVYGDGRTPSPTQYFTGPDGTTSIAQMTSAEKYALMSPAEQAANKSQMASMGLDLEGNKLSSDQVLANMSPAEQAAYKAQMASYGLDAAGGKLTADQYLETMSPQQAAAYKAQMASMGLDAAGNKLDAQGYLDSMSPYEAAAYKDKMASYGLDIAGNKLTEEQLMADMSPMERSNYETQKLSNDRYQQALKGELPISPALEQELTNEQKNTQDALSRKLGSGWMLSTPGQKAMASLTTKNNLVREEARRREITAGDVRYQNNITNALNKTNSTDAKIAALSNKSGTTYNALTGNAVNDYKTGMNLSATTLSNMMGANQNLLSNMANFPSRTSGTISTAASMMAPYQKQRDLETSALMQSAANSGAASSGMTGMFGQVLGTGASLGGAYMIAGAV